MVNLKKILLICCLLSLATFNAIAKEKQDNYQLGKASFNQGNYKQSLSYFNKAASQGTNLPELDYGLGSTHYKLKNYKKSWRYFLKLTDNKKYSALAYHNLGLISHKRKNDTLAIKYFKKSRSITRSEKLKKLNKKQISKLNKISKKKWSGYASAGLGYDSNIVAAPAGVAANESGSFMRATAIANYIVSGNKTEGVVAKATFYASDYFSTSFNDDKSLAFDISLRNRLNKWKMSYDAGIKQSTYGADDFQRIIRLTFRAKNKLDKKNELRFRIRYEDIDSLSRRFDFLDGDRQRLRAEYHLKKSLTEKLRFLYELEFNDRQNVNRPTRQLNYSPTRNKVAVKYDIKATPVDSIGGEIEYRDSSYDATPTQSRSDTRYLVAIKYTRRLDKYWRLKAKVKYKSNDSNEPGEIFDYDRTITTIDLSRLF